MKLNTQYIIQYRIVQMNNKLLNKQKSIWIRNFLEDGLQLLDVILVLMQLMKKEHFYRQLKVHYNLQYLDVLIDFITQQLTLLKFVQIFISQKKFILFLVYPNFMNYDQELPVLSEFIFIFSIQQQQTTQKINHQLTKPNQSMGTTNSNNYPQSFMSDYTIIQQNISQHIKFLQHKTTAEQYLLKQYTFSNIKDCNFMMEKLGQIKQKLSNQIQSKKHLVQIKDYLMKSQQMYCGTWWKIYVLWDYPHRTIDDQINQRKIKKKFFSQSEMWSLLGSSIIALSHLQAHNITHQCLKTQNILLNQQGLLKICHPIAISFPTNYQLLLTRQNFRHMYPSPEHCRCLQEQLILPSGNPYKADVFTLGIIILQIGLLQYQDGNCYRDRGWTISWEDIEYSLRRLRQIYSKNLQHIIRFMLSQNQNTRPDWLYLQNYVLKVQSTDQRSSFIQNLSNSNSIQTQSVRSSNYSVNNGLRQITYHSAHSQNNNQNHTNYSISHPIVKINNQAYSPQQNKYLIQQPSIEQALPKNNNGFSKNPYLVKSPRVSYPVYLHSQIPRAALASSPPRPTSNTGIISSSQSKLNLQPHIINHHPYYPQPPTNGLVLHNLQTSTIRLNNPIPHHIPLLYPLRPSIVDKTRPLRNIFPSDSYTIKTKHDIIEKQITCNQQNHQKTQNTPQIQKKQQIIHIQGFQPVGIVQNIIQTKVINRAVYPPSNLSQQNLHNSIQHKKILSFHTPTNKSNEAIQTSANNLNSHIFSNHNSLKNLENVNHQNNQLYYNNKSTNNLNSPTQLLINKPIQVLQYVSQQYPKGSRYQGQKLNNLRHGYGKFYYQDGGFYEGQWRYNKMDGLGKLYYQSNKLAYQGQWKNDQFYGHGIIYNEQADMLKGGFDYKDFDQLDDYWEKYQGQFVSDSKHGKGILYLTNGQKFQGQFRDDYVDGPGIFYSRTGKKIQGVWKQNQKIA